MSGKKIALIILAALSLMLPGMAYDLDEAGQEYGGAIESEPVDTSGALSLSDLEEIGLYENSQYGFQLSYPADWTGIEPDANDEGIVVGFLAPGEDMDDPVIYLLVQIEALPSGQEVTLDQYGQAVQTALKSNRPDLEIETEADIDIGGQPGRAIAYALEGEEEPFRVLKAWTLSGEYAVVFTYSAPDSSYDQFAGDISQIIGSFHASTPAHEIEELDEWEDYSDNSQPISEESDPIQRLKAEKELEDDEAGEAAQDGGLIDEEETGREDDLSQRPSLPADAAGDPVQRLKTLKNLLDEGLISQEEYDSNKEKILAELVSPQS